MIQNTGPVIMQGMTIRDCFRVNTSNAQEDTVCGGAVFITGVNTLFLNMVFENNGVWGNGGAVCVFSAALNISQSTFFNNTASGSGGALYVQEATVNISASSFDDDSASTGLDVYCNDAKIAIDNNTTSLATTNNCLSCPITLYSGNTHSLICTDKSGGSNPAGTLSPLGMWASTLTSVLLAVVMFLMLALVL